MKTPIEEIVEEFNKKFCYSNGVLRGGFGMEGNEIIDFFTTHHKEQLHRVREEIKKEITEQTLLNDGDDTFVKLGEALWVCDSKEDREKFIKSLPTNQCEHKWIDATNERVSGTAYCEKCGKTKLLNQQDV